MAALDRARQGAAARRRHGPDRADEGLHRAARHARERERASLHDTVAPQGSHRSAPRCAWRMSPRTRRSPRYPALAYAAGEVGTPQIRNLGTVGGNIMQRPRCWHFRNEEFHCLKKGGASLLRGGRREPVSRDLRRRALPHRAPVEPGGADHRLRRPLPRGRAPRRTGDRGRQVLPHARPQCTAKRCSSRTSS